MEKQIYKIETYIPKEYLDKLKEELNTIGALTIDDLYDNCLTSTQVTSYWRPLPGSEPYLGIVGELAIEEELKVEFCCLSNLMKSATDIIKKVHPYEKPVIIVIPIISM